MINPALSLFSILIKLGGLSFAAFNIIMLNIVTADPGSKPDQKYARRRDRQKYVTRTK